MGTYVKVTKESLTAIADAIRSAYVTDDKYTPAQMAEAITAGALVDSDTLTENRFFTANFTEYTNDALTKMTSSGFCGQTNLASVSFPVLTEISSDYAFCNCTGLTSVDMPELTTISGENVFRDCSSLESLSLPKLTTISGKYAFYMLKKLSTLDVPELTTISAMDTFSFLAVTTLVLPKLETVSAGWTFEYLTALTTLDMPKATSLYGSYMFYRLYRLRAIILRSETMCTLSSSNNTFVDCYHFDGTTNSSHNPNGDKDGYIYVPAALVDSYKAATNWSTYADRFRALEDYTVDGTITGELDETKI